MGPKRSQLNTSRQTGGARKRRREQTSGSSTAVNVQGIVEQVLSALRGQGLVPTPAELPSASPTVASGSMQVTPGPSVADTSLPEPAISASTASADLSAFFFLNLLMRT